MAKPWICHKHPGAYSCFRYMAADLMWQTHFKKSYSDGFWICSLQLLVLLEVMPSYFSATLSVMYYWKFSTRTVREEPSNLDPLGKKEGKPRIDCKALTITDVHNHFQNYFWGILSCNYCNLFLGHALLEDENKVWHLVRPVDEIDESKSKRGSVKEKERTKAITEIYLTRLLSVKVRVRYCTVTPCS